MAAVLIGLLAAGVAVFLYASLVERNWYALRSHRVPCLPEGAPPLRLLHLSDLHFRRGQKRKAAFLARCASPAPDLVVCTGDFLDDQHSIDAAVEGVSSIHPRVAALYVLGSHDYYGSKPGNPFKYFRAPVIKRRPRGPEIDWEELVAKLEARGWTLLLNRATTIEVPGVGAVDVVGLDDPHIGRDDLTVASMRSSEGFRLAIVHSPDAAPALVGLGYDLIVSGHTHGGQIRVPGFGALVTNTRMPRGMARGVHRLGGGWLHVSAGLGTSAYSPVRFACRPEVCLLELVPRSPGNEAAQPARSESTRSNARS